MQEWNDIQMVCKYFHGSLKPLFCRLPLKICNYGYISKPIPMWVRSQIETLITPLQDFSSPNLAFSQVRSLILLRNAPPNNTQEVWESLEQLVKMESLNIVFESNPYFGFCCPLLSSVQMCSISHGRGLQTLSFIASQLVELKIYHYSPTYHPMVQALTAGFFWLKDFVKLQVLVLPGNMFLNLHTQEYVNAQHMTSLRHLHIIHAMHYLPMFSKLSISHLQLEDVSNDDADTWKDFEASDVTDFQAFIHFWSDATRDWIYQLSKLEHLNLTIRFSSGPSMQNLFETLPALQMVYLREWNLGGEIKETRLSRKDYESQKSMPYIAPKKRPKKCNVEP